MKTINFTYNSVSEFGDALRAIADEPSVTGFNASTSNRRSDTPHSLDEAIETARNGGAWAAGARQLQSVNVEVDSDQDYNRRAIVQDVTGFMPNVPALLANHPVAMYNQRPAPKVKRYIKIGVAVAMADAVPAKILYNRGRAILAVVDDMVMQGYGVEIWSVTASRGGKVRASCNVKLKPADGQWSVDTAAFMLACSSIVRRLYMKLVESSEEVMDNIGGSYGRPETKDTGAHDIWFPALHTSEGYDTPEAALATVLKQVSDYLNTENAA
tara:strand:- start:1326 stop:2135 length:810 start_codon:yes stop_codon:yes gene_type:complete